MKYVALTTARDDYYRRYWVIRDSLEEIKEIARQYEELNGRIVEIFTITPVSE